MVLLAQDRTWKPRKTFLSVVWSHFLGGNVVVKVVLNLRTDLIWFLGVVFPTA